MSLSNILLPSTQDQEWSHLYVNKIDVDDLKIATLTVEANAPLVLDDVTINGDLLVPTGQVLFGANDFQVSNGLGSASDLLSTNGAGLLSWVPPPSASISAYGYIYNLSLLTPIAIDAPMLFDSNGPLLGIAHVPGSADVTVTNAGVYSVSFSVSGVEPNQFGIGINAALPSAPLGHIFGSGAGTQQNNGSIILSLGAGDVLNLVNHSSAAAVTPQSLCGGTELNVTASLHIIRLS